MIYLSGFHFASDGAEARFFVNFKLTCYDSFYPFQFFPQRGMRGLEFADITILYGGNGSGKTTALNVMAQTLGLRRGAPYNASDFFAPYCRLCSAETLHPLPADSCILTSDDVFDTMLDLRAINEGVDRRRRELFAEVKEARHASFRMNSLEDYDRLKQISAARRQSNSQYARQRVMPNVRTHSNGESAYLYFTEKIRGGALYLLDEPENSLSPQRQLMLAEFLQQSARFYGSQFVLSTHSPFLLAMPGARVYDLDSDPVRPRRWTELENVRAWHDFFKAHEEEF